MATAIASNVETTEVERVNQSAKAILCEVTAESRELGLVHDTTEIRATAESRTKRKETLSVPSRNALSVPKSPFRILCQEPTARGSAVAYGASFLASSRVEK